MTVSRRKDTSVPRVFMHKLADIRGGVSVAVAELTGDYLFEGTALSAPVNGICHVIKTAVVYAEVAEADTTIKVKKGHHFAANDVVTASEGGTAVTISAIDKSAKEYDVLTISEALGALEAGAGLAEAKEAGSASALKYTPQSLNGTGKPVIPNTNINTDAWLIGVTKGNTLPDFVAKHISGIINL